MAGAGHVAESGFKNPRHVSSTLSSATYSINAEEKLENRDLVQLPKHHFASGNGSKVDTETTILRTKNYFSGLFYLLSFPEFTN